MATTYTTNYNLGKQENHADKFDMDVITDNADKIDAALTGLQSSIDGKQAALTTAQLAAVNSGITSTDVEQIETNKNNILLIPRCDMDRLPITFTANSAGNLKGYAIYGNSDKVGIQTVNLFDKANADNRLIYPEDNTGEVKAPTSSWTYSLTIAVEPNTTYTISKTTSTRRRIAGYSAYPNVGDTAEFVESTYTTDSGREIVTFTTTANTHYVLFYYFNSQSTEPTPERLEELINSVQMELGSTMTDYEPYGYKIPITCGEVTTNIYSDAQLDKGDMLTFGESEVNIPVVSGSNTITTDLTNKPIMWIKYE